jgi:3-oxoacyl-(acyl-carrier-protein) synthase
LLAFQIGLFVKKMKIYTAGLGIVTSLGIGVKANYEALCNKKHGINSLSQETDPFLEGFPVAALKTDNEELAELSGLGMNFPRTVYLSLIAAREALNTSGLDLRKYRSGFISATTLGGMDLTEKFYGSFRKSRRNGRLSNVMNHECGIVTDIVAQEVDANSFVSTISTACSSSANSIIMAARMIKAGRLDIAIAGGADAISAFTLNGFNTLMLLDPDLCVPFDIRRKGLNIGEGAGFLIMVSEKLADSGAVNPDALLSGYSNVCDAFHQTATSPEGRGPFNSMSAAIRGAGLSVSDIDYINAHGTATLNNDLTEAIAIRRVFGTAIPLLSSTKSYTGHTLGASGAVGAIFSILSLKNNIVFPNLRFCEPIPEAHIMPVTDLTHQNINHVLTNSFGFGGNCSSMVFSKSE